MTIPSSRRVSSALTRTRPRCAWAAWCLLSCLLALAAEHASAAAAPREVRSAQELQDAVNAGETDIRLLQHVVLSELNPGTADAGTLVFPENAGDVSMAGFCPPPLPTHVQAYASAHAGKDTNACSIYTEKPSNSSSAELTALKFRNGRLYLTNVIINTADVNSKADLAFAGINNVGKATFGVSVERAQLWMVQTVIAFFAESNVKAVDSSVYFINSLSYQVGPLSNWNEGGIDFLQFADLGSDHPLTLYAYYTVFHQDNLHVNAPVYVGPLVSNATTSVIRSTKQSALKSPPQIVFDMAFAHTHETIQPGCTGICICAPGVAQPILFLNTTSEDKKNYKALLPAVNSGCTANTSPPMVSPSTEMDFKSVMPPGHEEWVNSLIERGVPNAELLLDPTGKSSDSSSSLSSGAIAGIVVTIIILLIALAVLAFCLIRRRKNRAAAAHKAAAADKQAFYEQSGIGPLPPHGFSNHQDGYQPGQQESSLYLMGGMPAEVGAHSGIQEGAVYNVGTLPHLAHPGGYVSGHGKPGAPSNNTQMTYSSGGSRTLGVRTFEARSAYEASSTAEGGASQVGSQYGSQYESLTEKREQFGSHVQIDFSELDSCLNEVERLWGGVLLDRYVSLGSSKRSYGGQGAVQFATLKFNTEKKVAIKFFLSRTAFYTEQALYVNTSLHHILPPIDDVISNEDGRYTDPHGRAFPPFVVMEKGQPLDEFQRRSKPDFPSCMQIIHHLIKRIAELHACGFTHRDLKPSNTIWLSSRNEWTIIDFGSTATIGEKANLSISLGYAPPESMKARVERQNQVIADPAVDVWALGVVAIELLTGQTTYARDPCIPFEEQVIAKTIRGDKFFWEVEEDAPEIRKRLGFMTDALLRMVSRDPKDRPTLKEVDTQWRKILQQGTMMD